MKEPIQPPTQCPYHSSLPRGRHVAIRFRGSFHRACDGATVRRFICNECRRTFSEATSTHEYLQRKRGINEPLFKLLASNNSMRRSAILIGVARKTVDHRLIYYSKVSSGYQENLLKKTTAVQNVHFDDMETSEHTKMKPISIPIAVQHPTRIILSFDVASMPAKGLLAKKSKERYGSRKDERSTAWRHVLTTVSQIADPALIITSDSHKRYPQMIRKYVPGAQHIQVKSRRACVAGQGELKAGGRDPLFSLNHTAAMLRANICRLIRRTWCTTKLKERLHCHITLYAMWHNENILAKLEQRKPVFPFPRAA